MLYDKKVLCSKLSICMMIQCLILKVIDLLHITQIIDLGLHHGMGFYQVSSSITQMFQIFTLMYLRLLTWVYTMEWAFTKFQVVSHKCFKYSYIR